jgi:hypothetical protein
VLPYVPASTQQVENVMKALSRSHAGGSKLIDLGSGDGRIVIYTQILTFIQSTNS